MKRSVQFLSSLIFISWSSFLHASEHSCKTIKQLRKENLTSALDASGFRFELDPEKGNQFEKLQVDFSKVKIVGLGEATHGTSEFSIVRHQIFRYLVERHGFRVFILEDEWLGGLHFNEALAKGESIENALSKLNKKGTFLTKETLELFKWIEAFNKNHKIDPIVVYGADAQAGNILLESFHYLRQKLPEQSTEIAKMEGLTKSLFAQLADPALLETVSIDTVKASLKAARKFETDITNSISRQNKQEARLLGLARFPSQILQKISAELVEGLAAAQGPAVLDAIFADQELVSLFDPSCLKGSFSCRDFSMAKNIKLAIDIEGKGAVFWAHNGHVGRFLSHPDIIWANPKTEDTKIVDNTGAFLNEFYGQGYFAVITDFHKGSFLARDASDGHLRAWEVESAIDGVPSSIPNLIHGLGHENFAINLRKKAKYPADKLFKVPQAIRIVGATFSETSNTLEESYMTAILPKYADTYIYFENSTPHSPL
ncbi:MAG TPA: erythromycin esterase family protein [Oligoflexus sp.]|uniref:erythromycin esterase family protein n=1 Tax=Oligoflexus sp. TaxID=1971216 RepID=UPI002D62E6EF|nr:erythromycin esterase family protein [Oligoflexus sp.]HYX35712.1 erythromycin esterase family protein [Oligoflexus sp.]